MRRETAEQLASLQKQLREKNDRILHLERELRSRVGLAEGPGVRCGAWAGDMQRFGKRAATTPKLNYTDPPPPPPPPLFSRED